MKMVIYGWKDDHILNASPQLSSSAIPTLNVTHSVQLVICDKTGKSNHSTGNIFKFSCLSKDCELDDNTGPGYIVN